MCQSIIENLPDIEKYAIINFDSGKKDLQEFPVLFFSLCKYAIEKDIGNLAKIENIINELTSKYNSMSEIELIDIVTKDPKMLRFIENQTDDICWVALKGVPEVIKRVKNQTEEMCLFAINHNRFVFKEITNQTENVCWAILKNMPTAISNIKNPTEDMCLFAVKDDGMLLEHIKSPSYNVIMEALKSNGNNVYGYNHDYNGIRFYDEDDNLVVFQHPIMLIENPSDEYCIQAITHCPKSYQFIKNPSDVVKGIIKIQSL